MKNSMASTSDVLWVSLEDGMKRQWPFVAKIEARRYPRCNLVSKVEGC